MTTKAGQDIEKGPKNFQHLKPHQRSTPSTSFYSAKLSIFILVICVTLFILFHIRYSLQVPPSLSSSSWSLMYQVQRVMNTNLTSNLTHNLEAKSYIYKLQQSVTFLPLKDLRYSNVPLQGHTWFMSSMYDTHEEGEVQYQQFPSESSQGRLLCFKGKDNHDGSWNSYALAWPEALPDNATFMEGLTFISYNHYNYHNIWHGLSAMVPFVAWHRRSHCETPRRWILYHWGEIRLNMAVWLNQLMDATFGMAPEIVGFDGVDGKSPVCFEKAVVMRHNEGGMSRQRRMESFDLMRCRARKYCKMSLKGSGGESDEDGAAVIGMTLLMRTGARSFKNESAVIDIFGKECAKVKGCRLLVSQSHNLSFCDQVKLMGMTDILVSPHGAQLANMFLMDRNSSVMEFFPKGWLKLAGVGQYVLQWLANWSGMRHQGAWRDPNGDYCPYPDDDRRCMSVYKNGRIGFNQTYFSDWAKRVLDETKTRKEDEAASLQNMPSSSIACACG